MSKTERRKKSRAVTALLAILLTASVCVFLWSGYTLIMRSREYDASRAEYDSLREQFRKPTASAAPAAPTEAPTSAATATAAAQNTTQGTTQGNGSAENHTSVSPETGDTVAQPETTVPATPHPTPSEEPVPVDFAGLLNENPETVGWIEVPGTDISYPIVQANDNFKYLDTGFGGNHNSSGAIFLDKDSPADMMGAHNIIYGHHMRDGSMFAKLVDFKDSDFFAQHDQIVLYTPERTMRLRIVSAYAQKADTALRQFEFDDKGEFDAFLKKCVTLSDNVRAGVDYSQVTRLYSFVTCSYEADDVRTIIHAVELP